MLVITDRQVAELLHMREAIDAVEHAFADLAGGTAHMPPKLYLTFPQFSGDLRIMPASLGSEFAGVKLVNSHAKNPERGLPTVVGTYMLFSQETGLPICLMGATVLTGIRTGAGAAVASKYLARKDSTTLGLVGAGVQASYQLAALAELFAFDTVKVWAPGGDSKRRDVFIRSVASKYPGMAAQAAETVEEAVLADIVCTTTPSRSPLVLADAVAPGTHINAVGADGPGKQELDPAILDRATVVVDDLHQAVSGGEVNVAISQGIYRAERIACSLSDLVVGKAEGRTSHEEITVFDSTGLAIQDIAVAARVFKLATDGNVGSRIEL